MAGHGKTTKKREIRDLTKGEKVWAKKSQCPPWGRGRKKYRGKGYQGEYRA